MSDSLVQARSWGLGWATDFRSPAPPATGEEAQRIAALLDQLISEENEMSDTNTRPATSEELRREVQHAKNRVKAAQEEIVSSARYLERMTIALDYAIEREAGK